MSVLDLYAGPGGLGEGFSSYFPISDAVDWNPDACSTYKSNHQETRVHCQDVREYIAGTIPKDYEGITGFIGGPPCQEFTPLNQKPNVLNERAMQLFVMVGSILHVKPRFALIENVSRIPKAYKDRAVKELREGGYHVIARTCNANEFGSVQVRRRWILTACKERPVFPEPSRGKRVAREILNPASRGEITPRPDILADIKEMPSGKWVARPGQSFKVYFVIDPDKPMPAVVNPTKLRYVKPDRTGYLSFAELQAAQGFPRGYTFAGNRESIGQQLANAVPVELARVFALAFARAMKSGGMTR